LFLKLSFFGYATFLAIFRMPQNPAPAIATKRGSRDDRLHHVKQRYRNNHISK